MNVPERASAQTVTSDQLWEIRTLVADGHYADALAIIRSAKALSPRNIYLIGLEKQVEKLLNLARTSSLSPSEKNGILESLSTLIGRAVEGMGDVSSSGRAPVEESSDKAKETALETLKSQYFQHADEYLKKGDYKAALVEIRRVFIIEPDNEIAKDYEKNLQQLVQLQEHGSQNAPDDKEVFGEGMAKDSAPAPSSKRPVSGRSPAKQSGKEGHAPLPAAADKTFAKSEAEPEKKSHAGMIGGLVLGAVVVVAAIVFLASPKKGQKSALPEPETTKPAVVATEQEPPTASRTAEERSGKESKRTSESGKTSSSTEEVTTTVEKPAKETKATSEPKETKPAAKEVKATPKVEPAPPITKIEEKPAPAADNQPPAISPAESERMPEVVRLEQPTIPSTAWGSASTAEVVARVRINTKGEPIQIKIVQSTNTSLNKPVMDAIKKSQFLPGYMPSGPVTTWLTIPFKFKKPGT